MDIISLGWDRSRIGLGWDRIRIGVDKIRE